MSIEYRDIDGFPGYRIGDDGSVWSRRQRNGHMGGTLIFGEWRIKVQTQKRYCHVSLYDGSGKAATRFVHRLVLEAFIGPCPVGMETLHGNGDKHDNRRTNLRWGTPIENAEDRQRHGATVCGERQGLAKLNDGLVLEIRRLWAAGGMSKAAIGRQFSVQAITVRRVICGETWRHV